MRRGLRKNSDSPIELYDLDADLAEANDVAQEHPQVAARLLALMTTARTEPVYERLRFGDYDR